MALPLNSDQQLYIDDLQAAFTTAKAALVSAIKADNDPSHNLGDARDRAQAARAAQKVFCQLVGFGESTWQAARGGAVPLKDPATRGVLYLFDVPSVTA